MAGEGARLLLTVVLAFGALHARAAAMDVQLDAPRGPDGSSAGVPSTAPVWLDLVVNQLPSGTVLVHLGGGDAWVADEDLARARVTVDADAGERIAGVGGRSLVSLKSLAPRVTFEVDEPALALRVTVAQTLLGRSALSLANRVRPPGLRARGEPGAFLNWSAMASTADVRSANFEAGLTTGETVLVGGATVLAPGGVTRGLTTLYRDDVAAVVRYAAGDVFPNAWDPLGGAALLGGVAAWREFSLDPYLESAPSASTSVFAATPSTLEVWVNGAMVRRIPVNPGTVDLERIPLVPGPNEVQTILRDAFGRELSSAYSPLLGSKQLAPGVVDWGGYAGFRRSAFGQESFDYTGGAAAVGLLRAGVTPILTLGGRVEAAEGLLSAGGTTAVATPFGEWGASLAASAGGGTSGAAADLSWRWLRRGAFTAAASLRLQSRSYANLSMTPEQDRASWRIDAAATGAVRSNLALIFEAGLERLRDAGGVRLQGTIRTLWGFARGFQWGLSLSRVETTGTLAAESYWGVQTSLVGTLPDGGAGDLSVSSRAGGASAQVAAHRPLPAGTGYGYRVVAGVGDGAIASATIQGQAGPGRAELRYEALDPWSGARVDEGTAEASGALVLIRGKLFATTPVNGSFTVLSLPGIEGVRGYRDNQEVGRTDADGDLLIPGLTAHLAHRIGLRDTDVPMEYRISEVERLVAVGFRSGTVETFDVVAMHALTGKLLVAIEGEDLVPEWGEIAVETPTGRVVSPIGSGGAFWLDGLPSGTVEALIRWEGRLCRMTLEVGTRPGVADVGVQRCAQMLAASAGG